MPIKTTKTEDNEKDAPRRTMLYFERIGLIAPVWSVMMIEKSVEMTRTSQYPKPVIILNRNLPPSERTPIGERRIVYNNVEDRDKAYERLMMTLESYNVEFIHIV